MGPSVNLRFPRVSHLGQFISRGEFDYFWDDRFRSISGVDVRPIDLERGFHAVSRGISPDRWVSGNTFRMLTGQNGWLSPTLNG